MRLRLALILIGAAVAGVAFGQDAPEQAPAPPAQAAKPAQAATPQAPAQPDQAPAKTEAKPAENPAPPAAEQWISGSLDFGYRWLTDIHGSSDEYRSVVNLGEGPKLFGVDLTIQDPNKRLFDRIDAQAYGWGGDPNNTARVNARKQGVYDFTFDYRNIAYFNAVPSYSNPLAPAGFDQQSFDIHRRMAGFHLDVSPGKRFSTYVDYERNSGSGHGIDTWVQDANNSFAVPTTFRDGTGNARWGEHIEYNRFHFTLEFGDTSFTDDQQANWSGINLGSRTTPLPFGAASSLTGLSQAYGVRGSGTYEKGLFTARPASWIDVYSQFLFSQPKTTVNYQDLAYGNFENAAALLLYVGQSNLGTGAAIQPHVSGNAGFELRPMRRLRVIESWMTDRFHDASSSLVTQQLLLGGAGPNQNLQAALNYGQYVNYNQQQTDVLFDLTSKITLRGGFRYIWGDASVLAGELSQLGTLVSGQLSRTVGLAGLTFRPSQKLSVNLDYEGASSDRIYFRTSLNEYSRARARARYQATTSLMFQANFQVLNNQNPAPDIKLDFESRSNSLAVYWTPASAKRISMMGEYDRSTLRSDIQYLGLFLAPGTSSYRDNAHTASSAIDVALPGLNGAKLTLGGSLFLSAGSRPTHDYQPLVKLSLPLQKHVYWNTEWQYYGFGESFYLYEGFRTHIFQTGLRVTR
ncbi:MAG TPA: hypothetical protein VE959_17840 [Bryobacteraceae bacterium]|nr:hypothetical protein [Bryobacteraceae bacterium]